MEIVSLAEYPQMKEPMADWFHEKWGVSREAYVESMDRCLRGDSVIPRWYIAVEGDRIVGGVGVIENDFHDRKDLTPNICALYTEPDFRGRGIAGALLDRVCSEMKAYGVGRLYLITDHTSFYERYGWRFLCIVNEDGGGTARMYIRD